MQRLVAAEARSLGCTVEIVRYRPGDVPMVGEFASARAIDAGERESVVARFPGTGGGRSLIFFAHPDGEPVAGTERWKRDPFAGIVEGGRIHGWGVADDLSGVAIMIEGLRAALATGQSAGGRRHPRQHAQQAPCARRVGIAPWRAARRRRGLSPPRRVRRRPARDQGLLPRPARLPHHRAGHAATDQRDQPSRLHPSGDQSRRSPDGHPSTAERLRLAARRDAPSSAAGALSPIS